MPQFLFPIYHCRQSQSGKLSYSPPPILHLTIHHRRQRTDKRRHNRRRNNSRRVHTPVLLPVRNHIDRYQLQRRNIQNQKRTHLIAGNPAIFPFAAMGSSPPLLPVLFPFFFPSAKMPYPAGTYPGVPRSASNCANASIALSPALCQVSDTNFLKNPTIRSQTDRIDIFQQFLETLIPISATKTAPWDAHLFHI